MSDITSRPRLFNLAGSAESRARGRAAGMAALSKMVAQDIDSTPEKRPDPEAADYAAIREDKQATLAAVAKRFEIPPPGQKTGPAYPPRAMRAEQSADYLSMSRSMFLKLVDEGKMPKPLKVGAMAMWDRYDIDHAFEDLKRDNGEPKPGENTMHKLLGIKP
jgi:predicted DNA-binding transcriptional regulator AlpA